MTSLGSEGNSEHRLAWLLLAAALLGAGWLVAKAPRRGNDTSGSAPELDLASSLPPGPELLVTADVAALGPRLALDLLHGGGSAFLGLRELCGFEPLLGLRRVALAMPFRSADSKSPADFAVIAATSLEPEPVLRCAEAVIRKRGGRAVRSQLGRFTSVRDQQKPLGEVAIRADGLFVLSGGQYFRDVIDAADGARSGDEVSRVRGQVHAAIRRRLAPSQVVVTALPGAGLPLPGVQALGLGLELGPDVRLRGYVACLAAAGCDEARQLVERIKADVATDPSLSGLSSLTIIERGTELELAAQLPLQQLGPLLTQLVSP